MCAVQNSFLVIHNPRTSVDDEHGMVELINKKSDFWNKESSTYECMMFEVEFSCIFIITKDNWKGKINESISNIPFMHWFSPQYPKKEKFCLCNIWTYWAESSVTKLYMLYRSHVYKQFWGYYLKFKVLEVFAYANVIKVCR